MQNTKDKHFVFEIRMLMHWNERWCICVLCIVRRAMFTSVISHVRSWILAMGYHWHKAHTVWIQHTRQSVSMRVIASELCVCSCQIALHERSLTHRHHTHSRTHSQITATKWVYTTIQRFQHIHEAHGVCISSSTSTFNHPPYLFSHNTNEILIWR